MSVVCHVVCHQRSRRRTTLLAAPLLAALVSCEESASPPDTSLDSSNVEQPTRPGDAGQSPATDDADAPSGSDAGADGSAGSGNLLDAGGAAWDAANVEDGASVAAEGGSLDAASMDARIETTRDANLPIDAAVLAPPDAWPRLEVAQIGAPKKVAGGYGLAESPLWDPCEHRLLFTDVNANVIHQLGSDGKITPFMTNTNHTNGIAFEPDGSLVLAQMAGGRGGRVVRRTRDGNTSVLIDKDPSGRALHTVDDVIVRSDGTLYFTDGDFPHGPYLGFTLGALPLFVLKPSDGVRTLVQGHSLSGPNGVELSPDERTLYLSSYFGARIVKLKVADDGSLNTPTVFASDLTASDSLCLDAAGNVYSAISDGLQALRPDGSRVKLIPIASADGTTNCSFGGDDGRTLFITSWTDLWKVEGMPIPGLDWQRNQRLSCAH